MREPDSVHGVRRDHGLDRREEGQRAGRERVVGGEHFQSVVEWMGPDEHLLLGPAREGILAFAGFWWDLGEGGTPARG